MTNEIKIKNLNKSDAKEFLAALFEGLELDQEVLSQRTKVCPQCDEIVKFRAHRCKHCGFHF